MSICWYGNRPYTPVKPCADSNELATLGDRLIFYHSAENSNIILAEKGVLTAGYVLGVFNL